MSGYSVQDSDVVMVIGWTALFIASHAYLHTILAHAVRGLLCAVFRQLHRCGAILRQRSPALFALLASDYPMPALVSDVIYMA